MSKQKIKRTNNVTPINNEVAAIDELKHSLDLAIADQENKLEKSRGHLVDQIIMAARKYKTVNGLMQARTVLNDVMFGEPLSLRLTAGGEALYDDARTIAKEMYNRAMALASAIENTDVADFTEGMLDKYYIEDFVSNEDNTFFDIALELLTVNLLQNVGPAVDDIMNFHDSTSEDIERMKEKIAELEEGAQPEETEKSE